MANCKLAYVYLELARVVRVQASVTGKKVSKLVEFATKVNVTASQETHGTLGDADVFLHDHRKFSHFLSPCAVRGAAGVLFLV